MRQNLDALIEWRSARCASTVMTSANVCRPFSVDTRTHLPTIEKSDYHGILAQTWPRYFGDILDSLSQRIHVFFSREAILFSICKLKGTQVPSLLQHRASKV